MLNTTNGLRSAQDRNPFDFNKMENLRRVGGLAHPLHGISPTTGESQEDERARRPPLDGPRLEGR